MANMVLIREDGIIWSVYQKEQTYQSIHDVSEQTKELISKLRSIQKPVRILIDLSQVEHQDIGARKAALEGISGLSYDKMAVFGASLFIKQVAGFIIQAAGKSDTVKYFSTQEEAEHWLTI